MLQVTVYKKLLDLFIFKETHWPLEVITQVIVLGCHVLFARPQTRNRDNAVQLGVKRVELLHASAGRHTPTS